MWGPLVEAAPGCEVEVPRDLVHHDVPIEHAPFPQLLHHLGVDCLPLALLDRLDLRQRPALASIGVRHLLAGVAALPGIPRPAATPALLPVLRYPRRPRRGLDCLRDDLVNRQAPLHPLLVEVVVHV